MVDVLKTSPTGTQIGFVAGAWVVETGRGSLTLDQPQALMGLLPLLERPYVELKKELEDALKGQGLSSELAASFPARALVVYALQEGSEYWKGQALRWLKGMPPSAEFIGPLERICESQTWPQGLRQEGKRLLPRLRQLVAEGDEAS